MKANKMNVLMSKNKNWVMCAFRIGLTKNLNVVFKDNVWFKGGLDSFSQNITNINN
jgi:hypothetical protein